MLSWVVLSGSALPHAGVGPRGLQCWGRQKERYSSGKRCDPLRCHSAGSALGQAGQGCPWGMAGIDPAAPWAAGWELVLIPHLTPFPQVHFTLYFGFERG